VIAVLKPLLIAAAKWLFVAAMDKALRDNLPKVYGKIDKEVPTLLNAGAPPELISHAISTAISEATGKPALKDQIDAVVGLYSPISAAVKAIKK
jgi:hypothetical protein